MVIYMKKIILLFISLMLITGCNKKEYNITTITEHPSLTVLRKKSSLDIKKSSFFIILYLRTMHVLCYNLFSKGSLII